MDKNFFIDDNNLKSFQGENIDNLKNFIPINDNIVNNFLNKNVSLESLIEEQIFKEK